MKNRKNLCFTKKKVWYELTPGAKVAGRMMMKLTPGKMIELK
jgi:hypothetical protein